MKEDVRRTTNSEKGEMKERMIGKDIAANRHVNHVRMKEDIRRTTNSEMNKAGYTATPVACGWAGAIIEVSAAFGQEQ